MNIKLDTSDMLHIVELLREDMVCSQQVLDDEPENLEAVHSMAMSKQVMLKVAAFAILKGHQKDLINDPIYLSSRTDLN